MMPRDRIVRDRDRSQFFTEQPFAELLVAAVAGETRSAADFAMGDGALITPIERAYPGCVIFGSDIDVRWVRRLRRQCAAGSFSCGDALLRRTIHALGLPADGVDVVVANPPFTDVRNTSRIATTVASTLGLRPGGKSVRAEVAFLALALSALNRRGRLSIVLPHALIAGDSFRRIRNAVAARYCVDRIYELPAGAFAGTEANTYILSLEHGLPPSESIELCSVDRVGNVVAEERLAAHEMTRRWDYSYWMWERTRGSDAAKVATVGELGGELYRGNLSSAEARRLKLPHFHTTHFAQLTRHCVAFHNEFSVVRHVPRELRAGPGDILIPRIGTRCLGHQAMVSRGSAAITDCVYRIRLDPKYRSATLLSLASTQGIDWRRNSARGTCAKFLTRADMMHFPVQLT